MYAARSYGGKVVLVTGASRGLGRETALQYARAGASVAIVARTTHALDETRDLIVAAVPGAEVLVLAADVRDVESVRVAVESAIQRFGKLDILIANAGAISVFTPSKDRTQTAPSPPFSSLVAWGLTICIIEELNQKDANAWWNSFEVNVRGSFNFIRYQNFLLPAILNADTFTIC